VRTSPFLSPLFLGAGGSQQPTEETVPASGFVTFPLTLNNAAASASGWAMPPGRDAVCTGHAVPGSQEALWAQTLEHDRVGRDWGEATVVAHIDAAKKEAAEIVVEAKHRADVMVATAERRAGELNAKADAAEKELAGFAREIAGASAELAAMKAAANDFKQRFAN
jgi:hypothetical protein